MSDVFSIAKGLGQLGLLDEAPGGIIDQIKVSDGPPDNPLLGQQYYDSNLQGSFVWNGHWWMEAAFATPVGSTIFSQQLPSAITSYPSGLTNVLVANINLIAGWTYNVTLTCIQAQQITNASATAVQVYCRDSQSYIPSASGIKAFIVSTLAVNTLASGSQTIPIIPTVTGTDVFTVTVQTGAASLSVSALGLALIVTRTG
jgi:hypothetical protein